MKTLTEVLPDAGTLVDAEDQLQLQMQQQQKKKQGKYMQRRATSDADAVDEEEVDPVLAEDESAAPFPDVRSDDGSDPLLRATRKTSVRSMLRNRGDDGSASAGDEVFYAEPREPRAKSLISRRRPRLMDRGGSLISAK